MKIKCAKCKQEKDEKNFHRRKVNANTFYSYCIPCSKDIRKDRYTKKKREQNEFNFI